MLRNGLKNVFRHFKTVGGQGITVANLFAVKHTYLPQYSNEEIVNEINNMEMEQLLIAKDQFISLTEKGENFVYGPFDIETGISEFMQIFRHFHVNANQILLISNILAVKDKYLSPQSIKHFEDIVNELQNRNFISADGNNSIILTNIGFEYLY